MGLVQNLVEAEGIATISITMNPQITNGVGCPRAVFARFPQGNPFGEAGRGDQQRAMLDVALAALFQCQEPGTILVAPYRWRRFPK